MTSPPTVTPMRRGEIVAASAVLAAALHDDPGWVHVVRDDRRRRTALETLTRVALRDAVPFGSVLAAHDGGRLAGAAVWLPPGRYPMSGRRKLRTVPAMTALALRAPRDVRGLARFGAGIDAAFPTEPVWYLQALGVRPDLQRRGVGHALVRPVLAEADRTGAVCYLETAQSDNVPYYRRYGFRLAGPLAPLHPGGPAMARMTRPAGAS